MAENGWMGRLFGSGDGQRDGQAHAIEEIATDIDIDQASAAFPDAAAPSRPLASRPHDVIVETIAEKILAAFLQNRNQTLFPLTVNMASLRAREKALLVEAVAAAMQADGAAEPDETEQVAAALRSMGAGDAERELLGEHLARPRPLPALLADIQDANVSALAYAASLMAVDRRIAVNELYLDYLAARLALPSEVVVSLNRRYVR